MTAGSTRRNGEVDRACCSSTVVRLVGEQTLSVRRKTSNSVGTSYCPIALVMARAHAWVERTSNATLIFSARWSETVRIWSDIPKSARQ